MDLTSNKTLRRICSSLELARSHSFLFLALFVFVASSLFLLHPNALAQGQQEQQELVTLNVTGTCANYNATLTAHNLPAQCYDIKVDVTSPGGRVGKIYDPRSGWKSSFFYVKDYICPDTDSEQTNETINFNTTVKLRVPRSARDISFRGKLRPSTDSGSSHETGPIDLTQNCPQTSTDQLLPEIIIIAALLTIIALLTGLAYYRRHQPKNKS